MKSQAFDPAGCRDFLLVLDRGDEVPRALIDFARQNAISGASVRGIGAFASATIAYWNPQTKEYEEIAVDEQVEVLSISGSLATAGEEIKLHAHVTLGKRDGSTVGGHPFSRRSIRRSSCSSATAACGWCGRRTRRRD